MTIHDKINLKQASLVESYLNYIIFSDIKENRYLSKRIAKNMMYGGYRNTCYDFRDK